MSDEAIKQLVEAVSPGVARHVRGTEFVWRVLRYLADVMEHG